MISFLEQPCYRCWLCNMAFVKCSFLQPGFLLKKIFKYCISRWLIVGLVVVGVFLVVLVFWGGVVSLVSSGFPPHTPKTPVKFLLVLNLFLRMTEKPELAQFRNNNLLPVRQRHAAVNSGCC